MGDVSNRYGGVLLRPPMPDDQECDLCDRAATVRLQGETDSWGAEWIDCCDHHAERINAGASFGYCMTCDVLVELTSLDVEQVFCADHAPSPSTTAETVRCSCVKSYGIGSLPDDDCLLCNGVGWVTASSASTGNSPSADARSTQERGER